MVCRQPQKDTVAVLLCDASALFVSCLTISSYSSNHFFFLRYEMVVVVDLEETETSRGGGGGAKTGRQMMAEVQ